MKLVAPFARRDTDIAIDLPGGHVRFTTVPAGDLNLEGDAPAAAAALIARRIGVPWERWAQDRQVHGADVRGVASEADLAPLTAEADGQATSLHHVACVVRVADCLPIALVAPEAVAMLHGGWRPLAAGVIEEGVQALRGLGAAGEIRAAIGPGAGPCCFEAGDEVHEAFAHLGPTVKQGRNADLPLIARLQLEAAGVAEVHDVGVCTICSNLADLYSHRRDHGRSGRQAGITWRS